MKYVALLLIPLAVFGCAEPKSQVVTEKPPLAQKPPMGWNSFDSYGVYLHEKAARANIEAMAEKLKPYGYEYFVIDNGWYGEYKLIPGTMYSAEKHASDVRISRHGLPQPSKCYFPNGLKPLADLAHKHGLKFGVHMMRGIPRKAVEKNLPIKGTTYRAKDIADTTSVCKWCHYMYGVDMTKPGAQEYYNSLIDQFAEWGVDFVKYDDIVPFPEEVKAVARAIERCPRPMILSLSPGGKVNPAHISAFHMSNMLRVTHDIWDAQKDIDACFAAWKKWAGKEKPGFWIDMDMIPFGQLQVMTPKGITPGKGRDNSDSLLAGKGFKRWSRLDKHQKRTFITLRALSASPLMVGGDLPSMDADSMRLLTNRDMLACNQNGIMGRLVCEMDGVEIWNTPRKSFENKGWIGIFNRTGADQKVKVDLKQLGLKQDGQYTLHAIWLDCEFKTGLEYRINANGVIFLRY